MNTCIRYMLCTSALYIWKLYLIIFIMVRGMFGGKKISFIDFKFRFFKKMNENLFLAFKEA